MSITLKQARFLKGISQTQLAKVLKINQRYVSEAETGTRQLATHLQKRLEMYFGWPIAWEEEKKK